MCIRGSLPERMSCVLRAACGFLIHLFSASSHLTDSVHIKMARRNDTVTVHPDEHVSGQKSCRELPSDLAAYRNYEKRPLARRCTTESIKAVQIARLSQHDSSFWLECSIEEILPTRSLKTSFTCKMMPRFGQISDPFTLSEIEKCCRRIVEDFKSHRNESDRHICRCDFEFIRTSAQGKPGICDNGSKHFSKLVWRGMQRHDQLCQCGCFDFVSSGEPTGIPAWTYHSGSGCTSYWSRRIEHPRGTFWLQYGVSSGPQTDGPDCAFTCKVIPKAEETPATSLIKIQRCCEQIAIELKAHRADECYSGRWESCPVCSCDLETIRQGPQGQVGICCDNWSKKTSAETLWCAMNRHDRLCSCGCFNFADSQLSLADTTRYTDWKRHRKSKPYWSREVTLTDGQTWLQYGVNSNSNPVGEPGCMITCKRAFISASGQRNARKSCKKAAASLASHLKSTKSCACDFESLVSGQECISEGKRWWKGRATKAIVSCAKQHDRHCACDCFEFL